MNLTNLMDLMDFSCFALRASSALHPVRILPFHFHFFIPMVELSQLRWDRAPSILSN